MSNYQNEEEIEAVVLGFESCTTTAADFTHASHLTVAVWYLSHGTVSEALTKMRTNLFRFVDHHNVSREKYNETITLLWLRLAQKALAGLKGNLSLLETTNHVVAEFGDSQIVFDYYSRERLCSPEAKQMWIEPDLKPLD